MEFPASSIESVYDSEEGANIYEEVLEDIPDDVTVYEDIDSDDSDQEEREKSFQDMKSIIKASGAFKSLIVFIRLFGQTKSN